MDVSRSNPKDESEKKPQDEVKDKEILDIFKGVLTALENKSDSEKNKYPGESLNNLKALIENRIQFIKEQLPKEEHYDAAKICLKLEIPFFEECAKIGVQHLLEAYNTYRGCTR